MTIRLLAFLAASALTITAAQRPNVILILTDDQGHGDLGFHHNPKIHTPNLDRLAVEGVRFERFHVSPVCAPTRSSLMTGRYNYRTGVVDTFAGRAMMAPDEVTIAQMLARGGYRTGIFGKWHLGDNYPLRAMDRGFGESLVINGGGMAQEGDPPFPVHTNGAYFDPWLSQNGHWVRRKGYITDVLTDAAIEFIGRADHRPFFLYLPFNAPHTPLQVPDSYYRRYRDADLTVPQTGGHPVEHADHETTARIYAMVECIDDNVGRVLDKLDQMKIARDTIVVFLSDNGPQQPRYNSGLLDLKGNTHEGGVRVPCFARWPGHFRPGLAVKRIAAHIDLAPTLLELCGVGKPPEVSFDGLSLAPLMRQRPVAWPDRTIFFQWHRGDVPELNRACAAVTEDYKLVQPLGAFASPPATDRVFELYDYRGDDQEMRNLAGERPEVVARMREAYEKWFRDVTRTRDYTQPPRVRVGTPSEPEVLLTRQDWRGGDGEAGQPRIGHWQVEVAAGGTYSIRVHYPKSARAGTATFGCGDLHLEQELAAGETTVAWSGLRLPAGPGSVEAVWQAGAERVGAKYVELGYFP